MTRSEYGTLVMTRGIKFATEETPSFIKEVLTAFDRYKKNDWGDMSDADKELNDEAVVNGNERIFAVYNTTKGKIYIITEWDRSATTILFSDEY